MLSRLSNKPAASRDRLFWMVGVALVIGQLVAFWMLCSHQVRKAQIRDVSLAVQRVAVADCLQYIPRATLNSCVNRVDPGRHDGNVVMATGGKSAAAPMASRATMSTGTPVSVAYQ
jgi:hypothetical protein